METSKSQQKETTLYRGCADNFPDLVGKRLVQIKHEINKQSDFPNEYIFVFADSNESILHYHCLPLGEMLADENYIFIDEVVKKASQRWNETTQKYVFLFEFESGNGLVFHYKDML